MVTNGSLFAEFAVIRAIRFYFLIKKGGEGIFEEISEKVLKSLIRERNVFVQSSLEKVVPGGVMKISFRGGGI